jgi:hypothetical protein
MVTLQTVEIPGYREAVKREAQVRDTAFLDGLEVVCGVEVVPLSLRRLIWLEQAHNGFVVPWIWEGDAEIFAHAVQFLYFLRPDYSPPKSAKESFWQSFKSGLKEQLFINRMARGDRNEILKELNAWIKDAFMDAPNTGSGGVMSAPYASYPAHILDLFAEAGLTLTYNEIMDMPLSRLWQHWRLSARRLRDVTLTNPSDDLATKVIAGRVA